MTAAPGAPTGARRDGVEQVEEITLVILWEGEDLIDGVYFPSKDNFLRAPGGVAFVELLEGDWVLPCSVVLVVGSEEVVNGVEEILRHLPPFCWPSLNYTDEVI